MPKLEPREKSNHAPLSFSQLKYWHANRLADQPCLRLLGFATRLCGPLDMQILSKSITSVVERHEALRTRFILCDGVPKQQIDESKNCELRFDDLEPLSDGDSDPQVERLISELMMQPIAASVGPMFGMRIARIRENEHILIAAIAHLIADQTSVNILLRDLLILYSEMVRGHRSSLPEIPIQLADYAVWQRGTHQMWLARHGAYWDRRLAGCKRLRFPPDHDLREPGLSGWGTMLIEIDKTRKAELITWCRARRTTVAMSILAAYVAFLMRWCEVSDAVVVFIINGRSNSKLINAVGYFASKLHLRLELSQGHTFLQFLKQVTMEYCNALGHEDGGYIESILPQPEFSRGPIINFLPSEQGGGSPHQDSNSPISSSRIRFESLAPEKYELDYEPMVQFTDSGDSITGRMNFPRDRFSTRYMERFTAAFSDVLVTLLKSPEESVMSVPIDRRS